VSDRVRSIMSALPSGILLKVLGAVLNFALVPFALKFLGAQTYAAFTAISGFTGWLFLGNGGLALVATMAVAGHVSDDESIRDRFWQTAVASFLGVTLACLILFLPFMAFIEHLAHEAAPDQQWLLFAAGLYCFVATALTLASSPFEGRYIGLLRSNYCNITRTIAQALALLALFALVPLLPNILTIMAAATLGPFAASLWFLLRGIGDYPPPKGFHFSLRKSTPYILESLNYLTVFLAVTFFTGGNLPLFALLFGQNELATAGVMAKGTQLCFSVTTVFVVPFSAALRQAIASEDFVWARKMLAICAGLIAIGGVCGASLIALYGLSLMKLWTGTDLPAMAQWTFAFAFMVGVAGWYHFWTQSCFAIEGARPVAICAILEVAMTCALCLAFRSHMAPSTSLWFAGLSMLCFSGLVLPFRIWKHLREPKKAELQGAIG